MTVSGATRTGNADDARPGRRDRKKQATRDRLVEEAARLFATAGFDETTTIDIADAADVAQRTLFRHFPTKEAVLYGDMDDLRGELRASLDARPPDEPQLTAVRRAMLSLADDHQRNRDRRLLQARLAATVPSVSAYSRAVVQASWEREIIAALAHRMQVDPLHDPRPEIIAGAAMSALRVAIRQWAADNGRGDFATRADSTLQAMESLASDTVLDNTVS